jgi:hypothetical protein
MQDKYLFEYAVIRYVPKVEREEFINIGVILFCSDLKFLKTKYQINTEKILALAPDADLNEIKSSLLSFSRICEGSAESGPIGSLPLAERFRWLTATRSTIVQTSQVHPGFCDNADEMLERVWREMVG